MSPPMRMIVLATALCTWEPVGAFALGPLHVHEGESTPHRDHEGDPQARLVAAPAATVAVSRHEPLVAADLPMPLVVPWVNAIRPTLNARIGGHGSRSPPADPPELALPLLI